MQQRAYKVSGETPEMVFERFLQKVCSQKFKLCTFMDVWSFLKGFVTITLGIPDSSVPGKHLTELLQS